MCDVIIERVYWLDFRIFSDKDVKTKVPWMWIPYQLCDVIIERVMIIERKQLTINSLLRRMETALCLTQGAIT